MSFASGIRSYRRRLLPLLIVVLAGTSYLLLLKQTDTILKLLEVSTTEMMQQDDAPPRVLYENVQNSIPTSSATNQHNNNSTVLTHSTTTREALLPPIQPQQQLQHKNNNTKTPFFNGCLLMMDDNSYLIEWLAYHYQVLPLRRLIVGIDPKSKTSPIPILNRYMKHNLIDITILYEDDYVPKGKRLLWESNNNTVRAYLRRQELFYLACMRFIAKQEEAASKSSSSSSSNSSTPIWVSLHDTDEFITVNHHVDPEFQVKDIRPTLYEMLTSPDNQNITVKTSTPCIPMARLQMATTESEGSFSEVQQWVPSSPSSSPSSTSSSSTTTPVVVWNGTSFMTLRYRYTRNPNEKPIYIKAKHMLDISRINKKELKPHTGNGNPHRPIPNEICPRTNVYTRYNKSPYVVHHYPGTYEQFTYRDIFNGRDKRNVRGRERYESHNQYGYKYVNDDARGWLIPFIEQVGPIVAQELLHGIGEIDLHPMLYNHTINNSDTQLKI